MADNHDSSAPVEDHIAIEIPASTRHLSLVRTVALAMLAESDLDMDALDNLRLAVGELVSVVLVGAGDAPVRVEFRIDGDALEVTARPSARSSEPEVDELAERILAATSAHHDFRSDGSATMRIDLAGE